MAERQVLGPQDHYERNGNKTFRDIRSLTTRLSETLRGSVSGLVIAMTAVATWFEPAMIDLTVPTVLLYTTWVLTRAPVLPIRLPRSADRPDYGNLAPGTRKPKPANGTIFLGWDIHGNELWITAEDARQHITVPGTTGAGKTTAILSLLSNAVMQGSGFVLVDGKGDRDLFSKVLALARAAGRDDDVRVLNFMVASGVKDSHTFNPFSIGNHDALRELLASQLGEPAANDANGVFRERAVALIGTLAPALVWLRDTRGIELTIEVIRFSIELRWIWKLAMEKVVILRDPDTGIEREVNVSADVPEDITWPLRSYLGELPGVNTAVPLSKQGEEPSKQHGYTQMYFTATFTQLAVSLGHIFRVGIGDIDMRDVVLNRRILIVNLPALENSEATLAALGKLVVASLRAMMAQLLGGSLEGDYSEADKPGMGPSPFFVCFDELAYYATSGLDRMLAMGRGLNVSFILGFQEVSGIYARLGEKTASLLGNANTIIAMRQQDSGRTRDYIEKTAGQTQVTQATSFQGGSDGAYREARSAEVRTVSRVDWNDLTSLLEGEAVILFGGRRVYARVFHVVLTGDGMKRTGRTIQLRNPDVDDLHVRGRRIGDLIALIESAQLAKARSSRSPVIDRLRTAFLVAVEEGQPEANCAAVAIDAVGTLPASALPPRPPAPADGMAVTTVSNMLARSAQRRVPGSSRSAAATQASDTTTLRAIGAIEQAAGAPGHHAEASAIALVADIEYPDTHLLRVEPPAMSPAAFSSALRALIDQLNQAAREAASEPV